MAMCAIGLFVLSCESGDKDSAESLNVSSGALNFEATKNEAQIVTVTANNVKWDFEISQNATSWIEVERVEAGLSVTVKENTDAKSRGGNIKVIPDSKNLSPKEITISQKGSDDPIIREIIITPSNLTFIGEKAEAQEVVVDMRGEGFTWNASVEDAAKGWLLIDSKEGKIIVTAEDNPDAKERSGKISVVADDKTVAAKTILVTQKGIVLPSSLSVKQEALTFESRETLKKRVDVTAVNCDWGFAARDENGKGIDWVVAEPFKKDSYISVGVKPNESVERVGYLVVIPRVEGVPEVKIKITQKKGKPNISTLDEDVEFTAERYAATVYVMNYFNPEIKATQWSIDFFDQNLKISDYPFEYQGTGNYITLDLSTTPIVATEEEEYYIPNEQDYVAFDRRGIGFFPKPYTFDIGREIDEPNPESPEEMRVNIKSTKSVTRVAVEHLRGSWYVSVKDGVPVAKAPLVDGKITLERTGWDYVIKMDFYDDAGNNIKATYTGKFDKIVSPNKPMAPPSGGGDSGELPDFGGPKTYRR